MINNDFYEDINCISDLLHKRKYNLSSIQGSSLKFAGNGNFYKLHQITDVHGYEEILNEYPGNEKSVWGVHDDLLFKFSLEKIKKLENKNNNFAIWINTLDSHPPNGLLSSNCKSISYQISIDLLKTVYCTDYYINELIENSKNFDQDKNNIYIVISDHFLNPSPFTDKYFHEYDDRRNLFLIIDPYNQKNKKVIDKNGNQFDISPTIINYLNANSNLGLGVSLLDEKNISLSSRNQKLETILSSFQDDLKKLNRSLDFSNLLVNKKENRIYSRSDLTYPIPLISFGNSIYLPETDASGFPKDDFTQIISRLFLNNKNIFNFEAVVNCQDLRIYDQTKNFNCEYTYINATESESEIILICSHSIILKI